MNKLLLTTAIAAVLTIPACANHVDKIDSDFASLDNDNDGLISKVEADDDNIWEHFSNIDTDLDGNISRVEYDTYMKLNTGRVAEDSEITESAFKAEIKKFDRIENSFAALDNDSSGYISIEEADDDDISNHFGYIDTNNDRRVSQYEFTSYINKYGKDVAEDEALTTVKNK
ncbi:EF-hand domain-containing protein [Flocculibacter collagenilyticus]|uniref:EF-hand domain-containing protein n=1 Tax=Flocculibacter collagenilyticus TaxID=2744479 RepID=UPI0018F5D127|nr:EF-hand domain-containing protein [Flocculibacter collagenilyticus]